MADLYISSEHLIEYLAKIRQNQRISPDMDAALLNMQQLINMQRWNPIIFDSFLVGGCESCRWKNRKQKCSCCRRNRHLKDCHEEEWM